MDKKVLMILSKEFSTDPRVYKEAMSLIDEHYEVSVICWDRKGDYPSKEIHDGVQVHRLKNNIFMKMLPHDLVRNPFWWWYAFQKALELYKNGFKFSIIHCHDLDTLVTGVLLKKKYCSKLIYDAHEIFGYMIEKDMPGIVVRCAFLMEKILMNSCDWIITADIGYKEFFEKITKKSITIVRNCKDLILKEYQPPSNNIFSIIYIGTLGNSRFFPEIIEIADDIENVKFVIAGKKEALYYEIEKISKNYDNIIFKGTIPINEVIPLTLNCHVVLCLFDPTNRLNQIGSPNKLFEAMVCGRPVIASAGTFSGKLIEKLDMGIATEYTKTKLIETIIRFRDNPSLCERLGRNALKAAHEKYNWEYQKKKLIKGYEELNKR